MRRGKPNLFLVILIITSFIIFPPVAAYTVSAENAVFDHAGESKPVNIVLDNAPQGVAGFKLTATVVDPETGQITGVVFPEWISMSTKSLLPSDKVTVKGANLEKQATSDGNGIILATLTVLGKKAGSTGISLQVNELDSLDGSAMISPVPTLQSVMNEYIPQETRSVIQENTSTIPVHETDKPNVSVSIAPDILGKATLAEQHIQEMAAAGTVSGENNEPVGSGSPPSYESPQETPVPRQGVNFGSELFIAFIAVGGILVLAKRQR